MRCVCKVGYGFSGLFYVNKTSAAHWEEKNQNQNTDFNWYPVKKLSS